MKKYTLIWNMRWMQGCHMQSLTQITRIEHDESIPFNKTVIKYEIDPQSVEYVFCGWPEFLGENDDTI